LGEFYKNPAKAGFLQIPMSQNHVQFGEQYGTVCSRVYVGLVRGVKITLLLSLFHPNEATFNHPQVQELIL